MSKLKIHAICVALFLVFGHIAMIAGMLDPSLLGYQNPHQMMGNSQEVPVKEMPMGNAAHMH
jgi:hypothetical protein